MLNFHASDAIGSGRTAPFRSISSRAQETPIVCVHMALKTFKMFRQRSASIVCSSIALILVMFSAMSLFAQTAGQISGHVVDPTGAVIPGATITLKSMATGAVRNTVTTDAGDYAFPDVRPGVYNIQASHDGFKVAASQNVQLQVQQSLRQNFQLVLGNVTESVSVSATGALLQVENSTLGTVVENQAVTQLPLNGRNYLGLVGLSANVNTLSPMAGQAGARLGGARASESISVGGQRIMFDYYTLDGVNNTDVDFNTFVVQPSIDAVQEFKVQTGIYPAEFGHEATQINVVTKGGTNHFHGTLFEFVRNNTADAMPYSFTTNKPKVSPFKWNDYGFEVDGPISIPKVLNGRDRLFFMANSEWFAQRESSQATATLPTAAMENGDFSSYPVTIYDPSTANSTGGKKAFPNNQIPSSRIDPISLNFLKYYAAATLPTNSDNYTYTTSAPSDRYVFTVRTDYDQSSKLQWTFRYSDGNEDQSSTGLGGAGSKIISNYSQYLGSNTWTLSPNMVNEARFGYTNFTNSLGLLSAYTNNVVSKVGIPGLNPGPPSTWGIPNLSFSGDGFTAIGDGNDGPYVVNDPTWQIVDNLSWVKGKHAFRFGFEYNRQKFNQLGNQFSRGVFNFQANATANFVNGKAQGGDAFADFLLGDLYTTTVAVSIASANFVRNVEAAYVDDTYKLTPKVTLAMGLRYELTPPWDDTMGNLFNIVIPQLYAQPQAPLSQYPYFVRQGHCSDPYQGLNLRWVDKSGNPTNPAPSCSNGRFPSQLLDTQYTNFAPRFSVSYAPTDKLVVRAGFGMFYNQDIGNAYFDMARNLGARVTIYSDQNGEVPQGVPDLFWSNAVPGGGSGAIAQIPPPYGLAMAMSHKTSYTEQYLLDVQQQVGQNWVFEAGYLGAGSRHLYGFQNANQTIPYGYIGNGSSSSIAQRTPFTNFGVIQMVHDVGIASYNAFSLKATRRFQNGFNLISSYTYSKSLDDTSGIRTQQSALFPQNSDCIRCDYALSDFDVRHRVVGSVLYELPIGRGKLWAPNGFLGPVLGGWQVGTIATLQTGFPGTPNLGGVNNASTNNPYDRPNATGASPYMSGRSVKRWFNPKAFVEAQPGFYGSASRNAMDGPGVINFDAEVHKEFRMPYGENHRLQIRLEAFNALNHPNWSMPNLNILSGPPTPNEPASYPHQNFGVISGAGTMRQLQLGAKYVF